VSANETSICIVDDAGRIVRETKVASEPDALLAVLKNTAYHFKRIGLEAGPLSQWLYTARLSTSRALSLGSVENLDQVKNPKERQQLRGHRMGRSHGLRLYRTFLSDFRYAAPTMR
jgi:hypothetical protein